jgi:hypothetical protein
MTERMLLEALVEHHGIYTVVDMLQQICDAKAAEMAAYGDIAQAKRFARIAAQLECKERV